MNRNEDARRCEVASFYQRDSDSRLDKCLSEQNNDFSCSVQNLSLAFKNHPKLSHPDPVNEVTLTIFFKG